MTVVLPHLKIAWGGSLGSPALEVWTNSLSWMAKVGSDWDAIVGRGLTGVQANITGASTAIGQWFQTFIDATAGTPGQGSGCARTARLEWVKLNLIGANGKYMHASNTRFYPTPIQGGGTNITSSIQYAPPWQATTAITLRTTVSRGRGSKGRVYPPMSGAMATGSDEPYQPAIVTQSMANGFAGLIDNLNSGLYFSSQGFATGYDSGLGSMMSAPGNCCIVSTSPASGPNAGAAPLLSPIYSVEVDDVFDVQTRRVNRVPRKIGTKQLVTLNL